MNSQYIVVEGLEGAGKTSAIGSIRDILKSQGIIQFLLTREPGGTFIAENLRQFILNIDTEKTEKIDKKTECLLFYAARVQLVETVIKPALKLGKWVISERHDLSTQAYQGGGRGIDFNFLKNMRNLILDNFSPNLTLYLDIPPEMSQLRSFQRGNLDRIEGESLSFFKRTRDRYLALAKSDSRIQVIDGTQSREGVLKSIKKSVIEWLKSQY